MKALLFALVMSASSVAWSQDQLPTLAPSVKAFVEEANLTSDNLKASCPSLKACEHMFYHVKTYRFKGNANDAFQKLVNQRPDELWTGASKFEMVFDPNSKSFIGKEQGPGNIEEGQVVFLELKVIGKMKIPVAFEIVKLDNESNTLAFSYIKQNKSNGIQHVRFVQDGRHFKVIHETRYKSDSEFRDKHLYGFFHTRFLNEFYDTFEAKKLK